jgi:hypothetical protein
MNDRTSAKFSFREVDPAWNRREADLFDALDEVAGAIAAARVPPSLHP